MARRKRGAFGKLILFVVLVCASVGVYTMYKAKPTQEGVSKAKQMVNKVEKAAKAAERAWK